MCSTTWAAIPIAWPSPITAWFPLRMAKSLSVGAILLTTTNRSCSPYRWMSSCVASCCTSSRKASCASGTSASWPIAGVPRPCHSVLSCSVQHHNHNPRRKLPQSAQLISGFAPSAVGRWRPSSDSRLSRSNSVLHLPRRQSPHDTTVNITQSVRVAARAISLCLAVLQTWSSQLRQSLFPGRLALGPTQEHPPLSSAPRNNSPTRLHTACPSYSIPIGPASAATTVGFLRCIESSPEQPALTSFFCPMRAFDTALGLLRSQRDPLSVLARTRATAHLSWRDFGVKRRGSTLVYAKIDNYLALIGNFLGDSPAQTVPN